MNKDNAHQYLPFVQALAEGRTIQEQFICGWCDRDDPNFTRPPEFYRVKPEPRRIWVKEFTGGLSRHHYESCEEAEAHGETPIHTVEFVEVVK